MEIWFWVIVYLNDVFWWMDVNHDKTCPTKSLKYFQETLVFLRKGHEFFVNFSPWIYATFSPILTKEVQNFSIH